jgi:hypothetical protein
MTFVRILLKDINLALAPWFNLAICQALFRILSKDQHNNLVSSFAFLVIILWYCTSCQYSVNIRYYRGGCELQDKYRREELVL